MRNTGWAVLFLLVFAWVSAAGWGAALLLVVVLGVWMWTRYRRTGEFPRLSRMIEELFTHRRPH